MMQVRSSESGLGRGGERVGNKYQFEEGTAIPFRRWANKGRGELDNSHAIVSRGLEQGLLPLSLVH